MTLLTRDVWETLTPFPPVGLLPFSISWLDRNDSV
jgi:hypothetical protein